jgi:DNA-binding NarL/FixJ family response regulator
VTQHQSFKSAPGGDLCESVAMLLESAGFAARVFPVSRSDGSLIAEIRPKDARRRMAQLVDQPKAESAAPETNEARARLKLLTPRELSVLIEVAKGNSNKIAAYHLGISPRTVEAHRARIMVKLHAGSLSELVRLVLMAGVELVPAASGAGPAAS